MLQIDQAVPKPRADRGRCLHPWLQLHEICCAVLTSSVGWQSSMALARAFALCTVASPWGKVHRYSSQLRTSVKRSGSDLCITACCGYARVLCSGHRQQASALRTGLIFIVPSHSIISYCVRLVARLLLTAAAASTSG